VSMAWLSSGILSSHGIGF